MANEDKKEPRLTRLDIKMATIYYPYLVECAVAKERITYARLVEVAKLAYPQDKDVQASIPLNVGRRLNALRKLIAENDLPDLASLVVAKGTLEVGDAYHLDPNIEREKVYSYDWGAYEPIIKSGLEKLAASGIKDSTKPEKNTEKKRAASSKVSKYKITRAEALNRNADFWVKNSAKYPKWIRTKREEILDLIMQDLPVEDCYRRIHESGE